jgi:hypothetical protein
LSNVVESGADIGYHSFDLITGGMLDREQQAGLAGMLG